MNPRTIMLPVSRGLLDHKKRMGTAIWEFLWFVDKVTQDVPDGGGKFHGLVLGGRPVSLAHVASDLQEHVDTAKRNVKALELGGYLLRRRLPGNRCAYIVANSMKWLWRDQREGKNAPRREGGNALTDVDARVKLHLAQGQERTHPGGEDALANKETLQNLTGDLTREGDNEPARRSTQLPKDFKPNEQHQCLAMKLGVNLGTCFESFCDHHASKGTVFRDWSRALNTWLRREPKFKYGGGNGNRAAQRQADNVAAAAEAKRALGLVD